MNAEADVISVPAASFGARLDVLARLLDRFSAALLIVALLGELGVVLANVAARMFLHQSFLWADEIARFSLSILAFVGGAVAYRRREHAFVRILLTLLPPTIESVFLAL